MGHMRISKKNMFYEGYSQGHKVIDRGVIQLGIIRGVHMPDMKFT